MRLLLTSAIWLWAASVQAQHLHVYGPDGSALERRLFVVFQTRAGACAPAEEVVLAAVEPEVELTSVPVSPCAREVRVAVAAPRASVTLRATFGDESTQAPVGMGPRLGLPLTVTRDGDVLRVSLGRGVEGEVRAYVADRIERLERDASGGFVGSAPADEIAVVVAHAGDRLGVAAVVPPGLDRGVVRIVPSARAVPSNGVPRVAAFVVVTDTAGRLSSMVPLHVESTRGTLRALTWLDPGVAAVVLSTTSSEPTLDLQVRGRGLEPQTAELPILSGWPLDARVEAPTAPPVEGSSFRLAVRGRTVEGAPLAPDGLTVECAGARVPVDPTGQARCDATLAGVLPVAVLAPIDGVFVPIGFGAIPVVPRAAAPPSPPARLVSLRASVRVGFDGWLRVVHGGGLGVELRVDPRLGFAIDARYASTRFDASAPGQVAVTGPLDVVDQLLRLAVAVELRPVDLWVVAAGGGLELSFLDGSVGGAPIAAFDVRPFVGLATGVAIPFDVFELSARVGIALGAERVREEGWGTSPVRGFLEVVGAVAP
ncbi:MAG: hypothetical protein R3B82_18510 [Sandaracinaceae bacterium]